MRKPKYFDKYKTKVELLDAVKYAERNQKFFNKETMNFFGPQKFKIEVWEDNGPVLLIHFCKPVCRTAFYKINSDLSLKCI